MAEDSSNTQNIAAHKPISLFTKQVVNKTTAISSDEFYTTPIRRCVNYTPKMILLVKVPWKLNKIYREIFLRKMGSIGVFYCIMLLC